MGFSRQEHWSGLPCPPPGDLPDPGTEPRSPALQADSEPLGKPLPSTASSVQSLSRVRLFTTTWTVGHQAPLSLEFSRKECWSGSLSLLQGIFPTQGSNPGLPRCRLMLYHLSHGEAWGRGNGTGSKNHVNSTSLNVYKLKMILHCFM